MSDLTRKNPALGGSSHTRKCSLTKNGDETEKARRCKPDGAGRRAATPRRKSRRGRCAGGLLDGNRRAGGFQFGLELLGILLADPFLDFARRPFDQVLGLLE